MDPVSLKKSVSKNKSNEKPEKKDVVEQMKGTWTKKLVINKQKEKYISNKFLRLDFMSRRRNKKNNKKTLWEKTKVTRK